jgi:hypothetical protein
MLIYILYFIGDIISRTSMRLFNGLGYGLYSKLMLWSSDLDTNNILWKSVRKNKKQK